eukprot:CAMPEP_0113911740 /NCGR_PEP_ID=MMETSP0780_2-20120614/28419_1 /TAXON_ID=652834 /ORGANISM="Palpitomonas bilix" /LENGTH=128 /DNA_ID=CAMNT_0000908381 /DNA_START=36 /DNA_END=418 /DNA_ORIENTATION=- /assembly_acc=CAM_ASM_000599
MASIEMKSFRHDSAVLSTSNSTSPSLFPSSSFHTPVTASSSMKRDSVKYGVNAALSVRRLKKKVVEEVVKSASFASSPPEAVLLVVSAPFRTGRKWWESMLLFRKLLLISVYTIIDASSSGGHAFVRG